MEKLKVYLDNCCYNRPFDDQSNIMVRLETEAKLYIQELIRDKRLDLVWSSMNDFENNDNPSREKRERIAAWKDIACEVCMLNPRILQKAHELMRLTINNKDALHIAQALSAQCDCFITTDKKSLINRLLILRRLIR